MSTMALALLESVTVAGAGPTLSNLPQERTFNALLDAPGSASAVVNIEACNTAGGWVTIGTLTLATPGQGTDGFYFSAPWSMVRARVVSITGTGAKVSAAVGVVVTEAP